MMVRMTLAIVAHNARIRPPLNATSEEALERCEFVLQTLERYRVDSPSRPKTRHEEARQPFIRLLRPAQGTRRTSGPNMNHLLAGIMR